MNTTNLPSEWEKRITNDGRVYYANLINHTTQWTLPEVNSGNNVNSTHNEHSLSSSVSDMNTFHHRPAPPPPDVSFNEDNIDKNSLEYQQHHHRPAPPPPYPIDEEHSHNSIQTSGFTPSTPDELCDEDAISLSDLIKLAEDSEIYSSSKPKYSLRHKKLLEIQVTGRVFVKRGTMTAYRGDLKYERGSSSKNLGMKLVKMTLGEGPSMMKVMGYGRIFVADMCKRIKILHLKNEKIIVNGSDILAFDDGMQWTIKVMESPASVIQGGIFSVEITGTGVVCVATHGKPLVLKAGPYNRLHTDPKCTVCWSGNLNPTLKTDFKAKSFIGMGSGEELQMSFSGPGNGFVIVQPMDEGSKLKL